MAIEISKMFQNPNELLVSVPAAFEPNPKKRNEIIMSSAVRIVITTVVIFDTL